ncbi:phage tail tube protein [Streptomyces sp. NPDC002520]
MPATPISATTRYIPPGTTRYYWVASISNYLSPTRTELNAGSDLTAEVQAVSGFATNSDQQDTPDLGSRFVSKIPGRITADDSSITLYASANSSDARTLMPRDTAGYIVILPEGDVTGQKMDVFPVKVTGVPKSRDVENPATMTFQYAITKIPAENITIP